MLRPDRMDVDQETALRQLEHPNKRISKKIVAQQLTREANDTWALTEVHERTMTTELVAYQPQHPGDRAAQQLLSWAETNKDQEVLEVISRFIELPDSLYARTFSWLVEHGYIPTPSSTIAPTQKRTSYSDMMRRALPATKDELIRLISRFPVKRPAATVRQFLRREGAIETDGYYHANNT